MTTEDVCRALTQSLGGGFTQSPSHSGAGGPCSALGMNPLCGVCVRVSLPQSTLELFRLIGDSKSPGGMNAWEVVYFFYTSALQFGHTLTHKDEGKMSSQQKQEEEEDLSPHKNSNTHTDLSA